MPWYWLLAVDSTLVSPPPPELPQAMPLLPPGSRPVPHGQPKAVSLRSMKRVMCWPFA
jgi:hypothetical protein